MKSNEWKKAGLLMAIIGATAMAQAEEGKGKGGKEGGRKMPPHMLEKYDTDGDGKLSETEREAAMADRKAAMEKFDADGDGQLNEEERETMRAAMGAEGGKEGREGQKGRRQMSPEQREKILEEFDADGDGELNEDERAAARAAAEERRGERPEGEEGKEGKKGKGKGEGKSGKGNREEMLKKYDTDADGKLSKAEREAMKADRKKGKSAE